MNPYLEHLAQRVADAPDFFACALAEYARSEGLAGTDLARRLSCSAETLTNLRLCGMPRPEAPMFWQDVEQIARRFSVDAHVLAEVARRGQSLLRMRNPATESKQGQGFLMAARDDAAAGPPPDGAES